MTTLRISKVLAIQNFGSSGSKFVHSLFDNHPEILAIPSLYMSSFYTFWPDDINKNTEIIIDEFVKHFDFWFDPKGYPPYGTDKMGKNRDEKVYVEKEIFIKNLKKNIGNIKSIKRNLFIQSVFISYSESYGRKIDKKIDDYFILYPHHTSDPKYAKELIKDFKNVYFLYIFREPIQTLGSSIKLVSTRWGGFVNRKTTAEYGFNMFLDDKYVANKKKYKIFAYSKINNLPCIGIRLEDLVKNPKNILSKVCNWLKIEWSDELLLSTYNGKLWWNRPESPQVSGFSNVPLKNKHKDIFSKLDITRLNFLLSKLKSEIGYKNNDMKSNFFLLMLTMILPFKFELLSIFPSNFSLNKSFKLIKSYNVIFNKILLNRSLKNTGLKIIFKEIIEYIFNFITLVPILSYIRVRFLLYKTTIRVINPNFKYNVVKIININD